ncbi:hypothetical protein BFJ67_g5534 [Fusarium oxysporum f. sp. cepae]|nr:hypothetical protein BFJ67_g5534 [Fusarium oxysporum f. sp. cepae]
MERAVTSAISLETVDLMDSVWLKQFTTSHSASTCSLRFAAIFREALPMISMSPLSPNVNVEGPLLRSKGPANGRIITRGPL